MVNERINNINEDDMRQKTFNLEYTFAKGKQLIVF